MQAVADYGAGPQRLRLPAAPIQGQDPLTPQALTQWMAHHERVQLARHDQVATAGEVGVDTVLDRAQPCLPQAGGLGLDAHTRLDVGQRLASPEAERLTEHRRRLGRVAGGSATSRLLDQLEEVMLVDDVVGDGEPVARCHQFEETGCVGGAEQLAHRGHSDLQHPSRPVRGKRRPELLHEPVGADHAAALDDQQRQQRPLLRRGRRDVDTVDDDLERPQHADGDVHRDGS